MKSFYKKPITILLLLGVILTAIAPLDVSAIGGPIPIYDKAIRDKEAGLTILGFTLKGITWDGLFMTLIVKPVLEKMSDQIVTWINNGFDGGPAFVVDPQGFFLSMADNAAGDFIQSIGAGALCSPFKLQIQTAISTQYGANGRIKSRDPYAGSCSLSGVVGNLQNFFSGDFKQGGWDGWFQMTQVPTNNPYGALLDTQANLAIRLDGERGTEVMRADWAGGFLGYADCKRWNTNSGGSRTTCAERGPTKTPGRVIDEQLQKTLGSEISQLELADEFDEILSALIGQLVGRVFNKRGIINAQNVNQPWAGGGYGGNPGSSVYACYPDKTSVIANVDTVTWTATGSGGSNPVFTWSGDEGLSGTGPTVSIIYKIPTPPVKKAFITVTDTIMVNGVPTATTTGPIQCTPDVDDVQKYAPIKGTCEAYAGLPYGGVNPGQTIKTWVGWYPMYWQITVTGGSGTYATFTWNVTDPTFRTFMATPPRPGVAGTTLPGGVKLPFYPSYTFTPPLGLRFDRWYDVGGPGKTADVTVIDADPQVPSGKINCPTIDLP